jgi:hypothetical protein
MNPEIDARSQSKKKRYERQTREGGRNENLGMTMSVETYPLLRALKIRWQVIDAGKITFGLLS